MKYIVAHADHGYVIHTRNLYQENDTRDIGFENLPLLGFHKPIENEFDQAMIL